MISHPTVALRKTLSANDVGATGSHQVGILVPKSMVDYFPELAQRVRNPVAWLEIQTPDGRQFRWRYIYYNNRRTGDGTRDEYRLTHVTKYLAEEGAAPGDVLEFRRSGAQQYQIRVMAPENVAEMLVLRTSGRWRSVRLGANESRS